VSALSGVLHDPSGIETYGPDELPSRGGWSRCPGVFAGPRHTMRYTFDILNRLARGELPEVTTCDTCLPKPDLIAYDVVLVTPC
jgi:hypothetical protein